jgi:asparagine synthase (glutamine-hydrolysing)
MCGIFALINYNSDKSKDQNIEYKKIETSFAKGKNRGPEFSVLEPHNNLLMGFHRLAINGLNSNSNQPLKLDNLVLICNGEIYNFKHLAREHNIIMNSDSDCEIILHMYKLYGIEYTLHLLDGVFAFILYDKDQDKIYGARDPYGVRPLFIFKENDLIGFSSEVKSLTKLVIVKKNIFNFFPASYIVIDNKHRKNFNYFYNKYNCLPVTNKIYDALDDTLLYKSIVNNMYQSVYKRVIGTTERPIACLLSGGLDSSLIACLVNEHLKNDRTRTDENKVLKTFSIGLKGSEDLKYAKIVAKHIQSEHYEVVVNEDDFFNAIEDVIYNIESYDTTTVRASVGNYLIAKYIKENSDCKVIFNGDGADELMGGYLYMKQAPNCYEFDRECRRLIKDIYMFDVLRSDKSISSNGLEPRTPFLDKKWVEFYFSIDKALRYNSTIKNCEKYLIRQAFHVNKPDLLPGEILWRTKEAFSDGVSSMAKSWYEIIDERINNLLANSKELQNKLKLTSIYYKNMRNQINIPTTNEQLYYRYLYNKYYTDCDHLIEYFWMPKYVDANDASARTLKIYNANNSNAN